MRITVISVIFIVVSSCMLALGGITYLTQTLASRSPGTGGSVVGNNVFSQHPYFLYLGMAWGMGMLISSIGLLKRKNFFRILFVVFMILACAGFLLIALNSIFKFGPIEWNTFSASRGKETGSYTIASQIFQSGMLIGGCVVIIILVMSKKASGDF